MKTIAIVFESKMGQTRKVAEYMKHRLESQGHAVRFHEVTSDKTKLGVGADVDTVILGAPVYAGRYPKPLLHWVQNHYADLEAKTTAFYSVSLNPADQRIEARKEDDELISKFIRESGFTPGFVASIAGALKYQEYSWLIRWVMKRISRAAGGPTDTSRDYEMTDWSQVDLFVDSIVGQKEDARFVTTYRIPGIAS